MTFRLTVPGVSTIFKGDNEVEAKSNLDQIFQKKKICIGKYSLHFNITKLSNFSINKPKLQIKKDHQVHFRNYENFCQQKQSKKNIQAELYFLALV
jgi:hypothetical protein